MGKLCLTDSTPFNLDHTLKCGQAFRWRKHGEWWYGTVRDKIFKIKQTGNTLVFENVDESFVERYFSLDLDLPRILSSINKDHHIERAIRRFRGLRIVRQDPWECLISYMCATNKNIPAIKRSIEALANRFGEKKTFEGQVFYTFPEPYKLTQASVEELKKCGLGFRAKYIIETAKKIVKGDFSFEMLKRTGYMDGKRTLLRLRGVGHKVADCVLLFSLEKLEAFPVDVWVKRAILNHYKKHFDAKFLERVSRKKSLSPSEYERVNSFGREYFGEYAGYAQEYLFHYERLCVI